MTLPDSIFDKIEDWADRAWSRFPSRYRGKRRIEALVRGLADGTQLLEDLLYDVLQSTVLDSSTGALLDQWGALAGELRGPLDDTVYRQLIRARIKANVSDGTVEDMIEIYQIATAPSEVRYWGHFPAGFRMTAFRASPMSVGRRRKIRILFDDVRPAGVGVSLCEAIVGSLRLGGDNLPNLNNALSRVI